MGKINSKAAKGCGILAAVILGIPLLIAGVVGVKTWGPLHDAGEALDELDRTLGAEATYCPSASGEIPAERLAVFLELRTALARACGDYGAVRRGFDSVDALGEKEPGDLKDVGEVAVDLGGASLEITPFLARYFQMRNEALLKMPMGLQEYAYIYAVVYHDNLLSEQTRNEIFSDGQAVSPEASLLLRECLARQLEAARQTEGDDLSTELLDAELNQMEGDPSRLIWQDGLPEVLGASTQPYRERLDQLFCGATAGLEMEQNARRAIRIALE